MFPIPDKLFGKGDQVWESSGMWNKLLALSHTGHVGIWCGSRPECETSFWPFLIPDMSGSGVGVLRCVKQAFGCFHTERPLWGDWLYILCGECRPNLWLHNVDFCEFKPSLLIYDVKDATRCYSSETTKTLLHILVYEQWPFQQQHQGKV